MSNFDLTDSARAAIKEKWLKRVALAEPDISHWKQGMNGAPPKRAKDRAPRSKRRDAQNPICVDNTWMVNNREIVCVEDLVSKVWSEWMQGGQERKTFTNFTRNFSAKFSGAPLEDVRYIGHELKLHRVHRAPAVHDYVQSHDKLPTFIIWSPLTPKHGPIQDATTIVIRFNPTISNLEKNLSWFSGQDLLQYHSKLGNEFVSFGGHQPSDEKFSLQDSRPDIHQSLVIMQLLKHRLNGQMSLYPWPDLLETILDKHAYTSPFTSRESQNRLFIILTWTHEESWVNHQMLLFYDRIQYLRTYIGANLECLPSYTEALQSRAKIGDIKSLDDIAQDMKTYRPITCYPFGSCSLQEERVTVHKRQDSCSKDHVKRSSKGDRGQLTCLQPSGLSCRKRKTAPLEPPFWFHQQLVSTFETFGEFRVFIVATENPQCLRGVQGSIICVATTKWAHSDDDEIIAQATSKDTFLDMKCGLTYNDLCKFALEVFEKLRRRLTWKEQFESLEIGARLDIAISPILPRSFFVNEITRWFIADFFSEDVLAQPKLKICEKYAEAIHRYIRVNSQQG